jgi:hypothetical protein
MKKFLRGCSNDTEIQPWRSFAWCLMFFVMAIGMVFPASASELVWGNCDDGPIASVGANTAGCNYSAAIEIPATVASSMVGSKVTKVSVGFSQGGNKIAYVYLTYDLQGEPFYEEEVRVKVNRFNDFELATPYVIEGKAFYVGYRYRANTSSNNPLGFDGKDNQGSPLFSHVGLWLDGNEPEWGTFGQFGNLMLRAVIEGDNLPAEALLPGAVELPKSSGISEPFKFKFNFRNLAVEPVSSMKVCVNVGGTETTRTVTLAAPVESGALGEVELEGVSGTENMETEVSVSVPEVNGVANPFADQTCGGVLAISDYIFPRVVVIEKLTGVGCGWCPRGIVSFERLEEKYPDTFLGIEVHNYSSTHPLSCASYTQWEAAYVGGNGAPAGVMNRNKNIGVLSLLPDATEVKFLEESGMVNVRFETEAHYPNESHNVIQTTTRAAFGMPDPDADYAISLVVTEDELGPYRQMNNYANGSESMGGFENLPSSTELMYSHVAREIFDWKGADNSVPSSIGERETVVYKRELPLPASVKNTNHLNVHALLIDRNTGEIVTAASSKVSDWTGVSGSLADDVRPVVKVAAGAITVTGADNVTVYSVDGRMVAAFTDGECAVAPGVYVVCAESAGKTSVSKVAVR